MASDFLKELDRFQYEFSSLELDQQELVKLIFKF